MAPLRARRASAPPADLAGAKAEASNPAAGGYSTAGR
jgi:hypothetical protein